MSVERINLTEREVRSIAIEIADNRNAGIIEAIDKRIDRLEESMDKREKRLVDDLKREIKNEMMPIIGDFKDKAITEAEKNTNSTFFTVLGIKTDDGSAIDELREGLNHAKEVAKSRKRIGKTILDRSLTAIFGFVIAAVAYTFFHFIDFAQSPTGKILGVMGDHR